MRVDAKINYKALELAKFQKISLSLSLSHTHTHTHTHTLSYKSASGIAALQNVILEHTYHLIQVIAMT
jgi:hypothetical protein